jgi:hypothetical protein
MSDCASSNGVRVCDAPVAIANVHLTPEFSKLLGFERIIFRTAASTILSMAAMSVLKATITAEFLFPETSIQSKLEISIVTVTGCWAIGAGLGATGMPGERLGVEIRVGMAVMLRVGEQSVTFRPAADEVPVVELAGQGVQLDEPFTA